MATQDRNVDHKADLPRKVLVVPVAAPGVTDKDLIRLLYRPRHNFRIPDLQIFLEVNGTATARIRSCIVKELSAVGAPQLTAAAAVTFAVEAFDQLDAGVFETVAAVAAQAFTAAFTVLDGFWGVVTVQIDGAQAITTKAQAGVMAFLTEADAIKRAPKPDALNGLVTVLTIQAVGADFVGATDDTDTANAFNTIDRGGIFVDTVVLATEQIQFADLSLTANNRLQVAGLGNLVGQLGDLIAVTVRSAGAATFTAAAVSAEVRKFPLQGESAPDVATGLSSPQIP